VTTRHDRWRGKPLRVLETREMIGQLRAAHYHRFELPLVSRPVEFLPREVPLDPYALGLLLGDGSFSAKLTGFTTADPELLVALERSIEGIELRHRSRFDYYLRHAAGGQGLRVANPVIATLRELGLVGTRSPTKFVPEPYLHNSASVRLAVLQGLLDTDGGPVTQEGRTCRVQYSTTSPRLREPFRLARKRAAYQAVGGGRPMRFVDRIEPAGEADTLCIQVAAADSLYVTDDFLVTHNTLNDSFIVLDEAQNTTPEQMKMFLTRLGFNSKAVVTGDITQIDLPTGQHSGLNVVREILTGIDDLSFVYLSSRDVVRHKIVQDIVEAYRRYDEARS
jgi:phosphate starvation-inducible PhoH-like protein